MKYRTIVADPPWYYKDALSNPDSRGGKNPRRGKPIRIPFPYPTMTVEAIRALPVSDLADSPSRLFLWATSRYLADAMTISSAWGFRYVQTVVWRKTGNPSPFGGSVAPNHAEFLIVAKKGQARIQRRWSSSVIEAPAANCFDHSRKPDVFNDLIEQVSPGPYLELFARRQRLGWDTWGNEALNHVELEAS